MVPAFEDGDDSSVADLLCRLHHERGEQSERAGREIHVGERVVAVRVETRGDDDQVRTVPLDGREDLPPECGDILLLPRARRHRNVEREARTLTLSPLRAAPGAGVKWKLVRADIKHRWVFIKDILRAVAVVHVPVDDRHASGSMLVLRIDRKSTRLNSSHGYISY